MITKEKIPVGFYIQTKGDVNYLCRKKGGSVFKVASDFLNDRSVSDAVELIDLMIKQNKK